MITHTPGLWADNFLLVTALSQLKSVPKSPCCSWQIFSYMPFQRKQRKRVWQSLPAWVYPQIILISTAAAKPKLNLCFYTELQVEPWQTQHWSWGKSASHRDLLKAGTVFALSFLVTRFRNFKCSCLYEFDF